MNLYGFHSTQIPPPVIDHLGRTVSSNFVDPWEKRQGVGLAVQKCASFLPHDMLETIFHFFVPGGLGDRDERVRKQMLDASVEVRKKNILWLYPTRINLSIKILISLNLRAFDVRAFIYVHSSDETLQFLDIEVDLNEHQFHSGGSSQRNSHKLLCQICVCTPIPC